ncbi:MAG TPA: acyl-CoA-binding protein [Polyangiaceae bacterium]|jgi:acyl-CoA-binding protein|nr:acyl-CoA-binding protein [Polyangiaceae bacterium]
MATEAEFIAAQDRVKKLAKTPGPEDLLALYSLFKQATVGDVQGERPGMLDFKGRAKYDAWAGRRGTSVEASREAYVALVTRLEKSQ